MEAATREGARSTVRSAGPGLRPVGVLPLDPTVLADAVGRRRLEELLRAGGRLRRRLAGARVWNINSTVAGGGVAEMLTNLVGYARGADLDVHWLVVQAPDPFFEVTKRLHNRLHGERGDGGPLGPAEHKVYTDGLLEAAAHLLDLIRPGDVVILHDPQTAGLAATAAAAGCHVVWRSHVGADSPNENSHQAWRFLHRYVADAAAHVYSRAAYVPGWAIGRSRVIPPAIDPVSPKNCRLNRGEVVAVLGQAGLLTGVRARGGLQVRRSARIEAEELPEVSDPLVVQVSRWDRLKDMPGVLAGFSSCLEDGGEHLEARLALVGPVVDGVSDDPEGAAAYEAARLAWQHLPAAVRRRAVLVQLPMDDPAENATVVNAVQRHAAVVIQKSIREGFGLTVSEAMWKAKPVVASAVGGIVDQLGSGGGVLLADPRDERAFAAAVRGLLLAPNRARVLGRTAQHTVRDRYLPDRQLGDWVRLLGELLGGHPGASRRTAPRRPDRPVGTAS